MAGGQASCRAFLLCNYVLLGAASCRPRAALHALTAVFATVGCAGSFISGPQQHNEHTAAAVLTAIFQGAAALLAFTRTGDFLAELRSYVKEEDGAVILRLVGGLGAAIFVLEWAALALAFALHLGDGDDDEYAKAWRSSGYHVCPLNPRAAAVSRVTAHASHGRLLCLSRTSPPWPFYRIAIGRYRISRLAFDPAVSSHFHVFEYELVDADGGKPRAAAGFYSSRTGRWSHDAVRGLSRGTRGALRYWSLNTSAPEQVNG